MEQLEGHQGKVEDNLKGLLSQRDVLYHEFRTVGVQSDPERKDRVKQEISALTGQIQKLRREVALCQDIAHRSGKMRERLQAVQNEKISLSRKREREKEGR